MSIHRLSEGQKGRYIYNPKDKKVFVLTNAMFFDNEYMNDYKPRSKLLLEEILNRKYQMIQQELFKRALVL